MYQFTLPSLDDPGVPTTLDLATFAAQFASPGAMAAAAAAPSEEHARQAWEATWRAGAAYIDKSGLKSLRIDVSDRLVCLQGCFPSLLVTFN